MLPGHLLPYRHVHLSRFEAFANRRAGVGQGPDPRPTGPRQRRCSGPGIGSQDESMPSAVVSAS